MLVIAEIDSSLSIGFEAVACSSFFAQILHGSCDFRIGSALVRQRVHAHAVEMPAGEGTVVKRFPVWADCDSVRTNGKPRGRLSWNPHFENFPFDYRNKLWVRFGRRMIIQTAPVFARGQIHHDDAVRPTRRGIRNERHAFAATVQVEPHVIQIRCGKSHVCREHNLLDDPIGIEIHGDQLRTAKAGSSESNTAGVKDPQPRSAGVHDHTLH